MNSDSFTPGRASRASVEHPASAEAFASHDALISAETLYAAKTLSALAACPVPSALPLAQWAKVLVVVPHPDDEAIGCGGLLSQLNDMGIETHVVLVSNGDGAGGLPEGAAAKRQAEFANSMHVLGASLTHTCWQLPDGGLSRAVDLFPRLAACVRDQQFSVLVAPWPGDMHPDHAALGRAAARLHHCGALAQGVLFYEVWSPLPARYVLDVSAQWSRKERALACHETALACGDYQRAMAGLSRYRSLLSSDVARAPAVTEAFYGLGIESPACQRRFRFAQPQDAEAVTALFESTFQTHAPAHWWQWKYACQPHPGSVAFDEHDQLIGFYGAQARLASWQGQTFSVCQQGDVMVAPPYRFATRRQGVFYTMSQCFLRRLVGNQRPYALSFGFPTPRAMRLGELLGLYQKADDLLQWYADPLPFVRLGVGVRVSIVPAHTLNDWQWLEKLKALPPVETPVFSLQKTPAHWARRFGEHPEALYHVIQVTRFGVLRAAAIVKVTHGAMLELMDLALAQPRCAPLLWRAWHYAAAHLKCSRLTAWGTQRMVDSLPPGERSGAGQLALPGDALDAPLAKAVAGDCWLLGGDTDFR